MNEVQVPEPVLEPGREEHNVMTQSALPGKGGMLL